MEFKPYFLFTVLIAIVIWISKAITERSIKKILDDYEFPDMMEKLRLQTKATEEIKTAINHDDWSEKEYKTLRRIKLEELVTHVLAIPNWAIEYQRIALLGDSLGPHVSSSSNPAMLAMMLQNLYFPELKNPYTAIMNELSELSDKCRVPIEITQTRNLTAPEIEKIISDSKDTFKKISDAARAFHQNSQQVMESMIKPKKK